MMIESLQHVLTDLPFNPYICIDNDNVSSFGNVPEFCFLFSLCMQPSLTDMPEGNSFRLRRFFPHCPCLGEGRIADGKDHENESTAAAGGNGQSSPLLSQAVSQPEQNISCKADCMSPGSFPQAVLGSLDCICGSVALPGHCMRMQTVSAGHLNPLPLKQ